MDDPFYVEGPDGIVRGLDKHYHVTSDVQQDPYGAWLAIQYLWLDRELLVGVLQGLARDAEFAQKQAYSDEFNAAMKFASQARAKIKDAIGG